MFEEKLKKRKLLLEKNLNPYAHEFKKTASTQVIAKGSLPPNQKERFAGRLVRKRDMGKASFIDIKDSSGFCQCYVKVQELSIEDQEFFNLIDIGDIVGLTGTFFKTKKGEPTLRVESFKILCKTTELLPEKYHGLEDKELRYRYRHLDLIMNPEVQKILLTRSHIIHFIRSFLNQKGFVEVETPVLQPIYGGALAEPFITYHNSLEAQFYLKISPELYLKRLIVGGFEKVFEIGKNFRNEGMDRLHNPEFTMLEYYEAYTDYQDQMTHFENLVNPIVQKIKGSLQFTYQDRELNFNSPWKRLSVYDGLKEYGNLDVKNLTQEELFKKAQKLGLGVASKDSKGKIIMGLFEELVEKHIWQPTFIVNFPKEVSPLTKDHRSQKGLVERFEPFVAGMEIGNAYTELNDPVNQKQRLKEQIKNKESHPMDDDFIHAVGVGMPPLGGVGLGIDRLVMILTNQSSIREVIWFPTVKAKS